jgi:hypothetical protein
MQEGLRGVFTGRLIQNRIRNSLAYPPTRLPAYPPTRLPAFYVLTFASNTSPANRKTTLGNQAATIGSTRPLDPTALVS